MATQDRSVDQLVARGVTAKFKGYTLYPRIDPGGVCAPCDRSRVQPCLSVVGQELWTRTRALRHVGLSRGLVDHRVTRYPRRRCTRYRPRKPCVRLNLRGKCPRILRTGALDFSAYTRHPPLEPCSTVSLSRNPTSIFLSLSLSFLLASLHSCSPFPRVINHALNSTLSLYRAYTLSELAENLSPPPSSRFVDRHHESVCKSIRYRFHVHTGFFTIELCVKYPEGGAEDSARWIFSGRWPPLLSQLSPGRGGLDVIRYTRALRSIFIFASHAFDRAHRNPWLRFRDKIVFPKINCSRRLGVSRTERAVSRPLVQEAVGSPRTAMMMECRERQTYAKDSCW